MNKWELINKVENIFVAIETGMITLQQGEKQLIDFINSKEEKVDDKKQDKK